MMIRKLKSKFHQLKENPQSRLNARNSAFSVGEYVVNASSLILLTPLFFKYLDAEVFGVYILINTIIGATSIFNMGLGQSTLYFVARARAKGEHGRMAEIVETTLSMFLLLSLLAGAVIYFSSGILVTHVFHVQVEHQASAMSAMRLVAFGLPFFYIKVVADSAIRGCERFDYSTMTNLAGRLFVFGLQILLLMRGFGLEAMVLVLLAGNLLSGALKMVLIKRYLIEDLHWFPRFRLRVFKETFHYGMYTWMTSILGMLRTQGDTLIVGGLLGPEMLAFYEVPKRLLAQVYNVLRQSFSYLFPYISGLKAMGDQRGIEDAYLKSTLAICAASSVLLALLCVFAEPILSLWLGQARMAQVLLITQIMSLRYAVYPLSIVNSFFLRGCGQVRIQTFIMGINCVVILTSVGLLTYFYGLVGAACGQLVVFLNISINRFLVETAVLGRADLLRVVVPICTPVLAIFSSILLLDLSGDGGALLFIQQAISSLLVSVVVVVLMLGIVYVKDRKRWGAFKFC